MKRTPLKRKTPLRKRARKKAHSQSWFKQKVYDAFMARGRGQPCAVCGNTIDQFRMPSCYHHIVSKGSCPHHICTDEMVIVLCPEHHRWAHGGGLGNGKAMNPFKVQSFLEWLEEHHPDKYDWCMMHQHDTADKCGKIDWKELYENHD